MSASVRLMIQGHSARRASSRVRQCHLLIKISEIKSETYTIHIHIHTYMTYLCRSTSIQLLRLSSLRSHIQDACVGFITRKYCVKSSYCLRLHVSHFCIAVVPFTCCVLEVTQSRSAGCRVCRVNVHTDTYSHSH